MSYTAKLTERLALAATIPADQRGASDTNSDVVDMRNHRRALVVAIVGDIATGATFNVTVYANTANSTSGGTAITGKSFTAASFSGTGGSNQEGLIEVSAEEVAAAVAGGRYLFATATVAGGNVDYALAILVDDSRYGPSTEYDLASVAEIVS